MNNSTPQIKVIISAGGTGGHIYPAIAVAQELSKQFANIDILFVGAKGKMEMEKVPKAGYKIEGLWISGFQRSLSSKNLSFPFKVISSLYNANKIINSFKPSIVIGFGGYASSAIVFMAAQKGIPTLIHEQNSYAGITNKILKNKVNKICVAYENMQKFFPAQKLVLTGNPIREDITIKSVSKEIALKHFGLNQNKKTLLIIGGSLGARTINTAIFSGLNRLNSLNIIWQKGNNFPQADTLETQDAYISNFIYEMEFAYAAADIVISRAGALSIAELQATGKPCILVPSPNVAEDHQTKNALALTNRNAAILVKDEDANLQLIDEALKLSMDENLQLTLGSNIKKMAVLNAAELIVKEVVKLIN